MKAESKRYHDNDIKFRKIAKKSINKEPLLDQYPYLIDSYLSFDSLLLPTM